MSSTCDPGHASMGSTQTQQVDEDSLRVLLPNNAFVPPKGGICFINDIPPELLSRIFELGAVENDSEDEDGIGREDEEEETDEDEEEETDEDEEETDEDEEEETDEDKEEETDEDEEEETDEDEDSEWPPFQILVSHVCHHWRDVALSTPSLWTTIDVTPEAHPPYEPVSMFLQRSKGLPIDVHIDCEPDESDMCCGPTDADVEVLYRLLIPHVHRWRTIELSVSKYRHMFLFLNAVSDPYISAAPQLTVLQLHHQEDMDEFDNFEYPSMSKHLILFGGLAPRLTNVVLWGVHVDWNQPWIASASKLVDLELAFHTEDVRPTWAQLATILRGASSLEKLSLRLSGPSGEPSEWSIEHVSGSPGDLNAPVQLPKVTDFALAFHSQVHSIGLLRKFVFPALKSLALDFDHGNYTELVRVLAGPATSGSPSSTKEQPRSLLSSLDCLKIAGLPCRPECIEMLYGELQNLTLLNVSLSYLPDRFLDILCTSCTLSGRGDIWLPRLTTLFVSGTSGDVLRNVVKARKSAGVPLESLYVEESCDLNRKDMEWLRRNLTTFELFEGSDDEDMSESAGFEDLHEDDEVDAWSDVDSSFSF